MPTSTCWAGSRTSRKRKAFLGTRETDKRGKLVEYLLEHPDFAKNFATQWTVLLIGRGNQGRMVDRAALDRTGCESSSRADRPWNEIVHDLVSATGSNKENGAVNYVLAHLEFDAVPLDFADDPAVPGPADPVHPVPRPPVERLEADRFLGDQRLLQGDARPRT